MDASSNSEFSFAAFAQRPCCVQMNRKLINLAALGSEDRVIDIGCGTGESTILIAEKVLAGLRGEIVAIDTSPVELNHARDNLARFGGRVRFERRRAERLDFLASAWADRVMFCNGIHLVEGKNRLVAEVRRVLKPDGVFGLSTSFFAGAERPGTHRFFKRWLLKALRELKREGFAREGSRSEARNRLSIEDYREILESHGFSPEIFREVVELNLEDHEVICGYKLWVEGLLPGIPLDVGSAVLRATVRETFEEMGLETMQREWLLMVARVS